MAVFQGFATDWVSCIALNSNDVLGSISRFYEPTSYGAGIHTEVVSNGDFTLQYTINVVAPLKWPSIHSRSFDRGA